MGAFAIIRYPKGVRRNLAEQKVRASFARQGFPALRSITREHLLILHCPKILGGATQVIHREDGSFALYTGTLFYKNLTGRKALEALLLLDPPKYPPPGDLSGCFALIISTPAYGLRLMRDPMDIYKIYKDQQGRVWSSSFLALLESISNPSVNHQSACEYVFTGAVFGTDTLIEQISTTEALTLYQIGTNVTPCTRHKLMIFPPPPRPLQDVVSENLRLLRRRISMIRDTCQNDIDIELMPGPDTRLLLALMLEDDAIPRLHYKSPFEPTHPTHQLNTLLHAAGDRACAISDDDIITGPGSPTGEDLALDLEKTFQRHDGCPTSGIMELATGTREPDLRFKNNFLSLTADGGGIYRKMMDLSSGPAKLKNVLAHFQRNVDPAACTHRFSEQKYIQNLEQKVARIFPRASHLHPAQTEYLYAGFHGRHWIGHNVSLDQRFGNALPLYLDETLVRSALKIPIEMKKDGRIQLEMIRAVEREFPEIELPAHHIPPAPDRSFSQRLKAWLSRATPLVARRLSARVHNRLSPPDLPAHLSADNWNRALPEGTPHIDHLFHKDKLCDPAQLDRALTLEYLCQSRRDIRF